MVAALRPGRRHLLAAAATVAGALPAQATEGLRSIAARHGVTYGCAVQADWLQTDAVYAAAIAREAAALVPEGGAKWWDLRPAEGRFDFSALDAITGFAAKHGQVVRGHTLVWHAAMRPWTEAALEAGPARARRELEAHLDGVLGHAAGSIRDWDVANEAVADPWNSTELLKDSPWLRALGPAYLDLAFRLARARDLGLTLTYNDYGCEHDTPHDAEKRRRVLALVRGMLDRGVPIDAVGLQGHLHRDAAFSAPALASFVRSLRDLGLAVLITELDVIEPPEPSDPAPRDAAAAAITHAFVSTVLEAGGRAVLTWGITDPYSWANTEPAMARADGLPGRPLPLDAGFRPKPMWHALARAFAGQPWP
ncbi:endo-1,4-beta-xylanase [Siccirubricoccus sp. G192]|uniref:endo-1,4-beta-xylanase n=1 Tax=Siccirubricoccus sp. G192 TaxID=2849651 RepID=UPI001C2BB9F3|nr:endo-1,4-beta-xylanase [Siccirubricoccus sp. G192]MBV1797383.1 endo-1,4-beta-xylanase [Siccirubricoccus sp. G192]